MSRAASLAALAVFSGLSFNLVLSGLGMCGVAADKEKDGRFPFFQMGILFTSVVVLWASLQAVFPLLGFFEYIVLFPASAVLCRVLESFFLTFRKKAAPPPVFDSLTGYDGLAGSALLLARLLAAGFAEALAAASGFTLGVMAVMLVLREIRRRSLLEAVPSFLRGSPLLLISMGLLSLIFTSAAAVLFRALGG
ncbi:MAG: hypothetical protein LBK08_08885 [Treponema sp.]|nr:hypothetical protein [Treponema sp.]